MQTNNHRWTGTCLFVSSPSLWGCTDVFGLYEQNAYVVVDEIQFVPLGVIVVTKNGLWDLPSHYVPAVRSSCEKLLICALCSNSIRTRTNGFTRIGVRVRVFVHLVSRNSTLCQCHCAQPLWRCSHRRGTVVSVYSVSGSQCNILWKHCSSFPAEGRGETDAQIEMKARPDKKDGGENNCNRGAKKQNRWRVKMYLKGEGK